MCFPACRSGPLLALLVLVWGLCAPSGASAQTAGNGESLGQALERLAATAEVSLVYDADLVRGHDAPCPIDRTAPEATLRCLLTETDLDFVQTSSGTYIVKPDVRRPPQRGTVHGVVRDADTGTPLPQAHVKLADTTTGTATDTDGHFRLSALLAGQHTLVVSHLGYETARVDVTVSPDGPASPTVALSPTPLTTDPVVVNALTAEHLAPSRSHATLAPDQLEQASVAGTPSVAHAAGTLLGVTTQAPYADLHMQGDASSDHEVRLDGVPVRNPATAGRLLGAFSPLALDGVTARTAGFDALRGDVLSGVIDLEHDLQRPDVRYGTVRIDPTSVNGRGETTADLGGAPATVMGAGRIGMWDVHQSKPLSRLINTWSVLDPVLTAAQLSADTLRGFVGNRRVHPRSQFYDLHGAARVSLGATRHLSASVYHGRSALGADLVTDPEAWSTFSSSGTDAPSPSQPVEVPTSDRYEWTNTAAQARYDTRLSDQAVGHVQASLSRYRATSTYEVGPLRGTVDPSTSVLARLAQSEVGGSHTNNAVTEVGLDGTVDLSVSDRTQFTLSAGLTSMSTHVRLANAFTGRFHHTARATRLTTAGQAEVALGPVTLDGGLRMTTLPNRNRVFIEPRGAVRYHRPRTALGTVSVRVGGGLYRQYTTQFELSRDGATAVVPTAQVWMPVPNGLAPPRTYHLSTDVAWQPHSSWTVGAEGYAKWQPHLLAVDYPALRSAGPSSPPTPSTVLSTSHGQTSGGGVRVSYDGTWGRGTVRYAYTRARRTFPGRFDGRRVPVPWAAPHRLTVNGRVPLGEPFALDLRGTGAWGRSWGYRRAYYAYLRSGDLDGQGPDLSRPGNHVLPPLYRMDASLVATHEWGNVTVTGRIGLVNVLGRANVADWGLRPTENQSVTRWPRTLPGRRSVVSLKIQY